MRRRARARLRSARATGAMTDPARPVRSLVRRGARPPSPTIPTRWRVATVDARGQPSARMVLLKGHDARGFVFYTNLESRKAERSAASPRAALLFHWKSLRRQVRDRRAGRARQRCRGRRLFRHARPRFAARRLGVGPVAPARRARDLRGALRRDGGALRRRRRCRARRTGRAIASRPSASNSGRIAPTASTNAACSPRTAGGWTEGLLYP